ncbi:MAG: hypothetical protein ABSE49_20845 [Polyangiaceae bacterium]|jgi:hypothetical protein
MGRRRAQRLYRKQYTVPSPLTAADELTAPPVRNVHFGVPAASTA